MRSVGLSVVQKVTIYTGRNGSDMLQEQITVMGTRVNSVILVHIYNIGWY